MNGPAHRLRRIAASFATSATRCFLTGSFAVLRVLAAVARPPRPASVPLPLVEGALDVLLGDETVDRLDNRSWHRNGCDQIIAGIGQRLTLRGISRNHKDVERGARRTRSQNDPKRGCLGREIVPI